MSELQTALDEAVQCVKRNGRLSQYFDGGRVTLRGPWQFHRAG